MTNKPHQEILDFLESCSEVDLKTIQMNIKLAEDIKHYQNTYVISNKELAREFGVSKSEIKKMKKGAYDFSLKEVAKIRTMYAEKMAEENASIKLAKNVKD